jgi:hypothetical protein
MKTGKKKIFDHAGAPWRGRKKAHWDIRGVNKKFFQPPS